MTKTMKAAVVHEFGQPLAIEEVPVPTPLAGQILVKIAAPSATPTCMRSKASGLKPKIFTAPCANHLGIPRK